MRGLIRSFGYAFRGIFYTLKHERNMRIHFVCMIYMYSFLLMADFFEITRTQFAIIFLANALVVSLELVNTAVERTVDLASTEWTDNGRAKGNPVVVTCPEPLRTARLPLGACS